MNHILTAAQKEQYREQGYLILCSVIPLQDIEALKSGIHGLVECSLREQRSELPWINKEKRLPDLCFAKMP